MARSLLTLPMSFIARGRPCSVLRQMLLQARPTPVRRRRPPSATRRRPSAASPRWSTTTRSPIRPQRRIHPICRRQGTRRRTDRLATRHLQARHRRARHRRAARTIRPAPRNPIVTIHQTPAPRPASSGATTHRRARKPATASRPAKAPTTKAQTTSHRPTRHRTMRPPPMQQPRQRKTCRRPSTWLQP